MEKGQVSDGNFSCETPNSRFKIQDSKEIEIRCDLGVTVASSPLDIFTLCFLKYISEDMQRATATEDN